MKNKLIIDDDEKKTYEPLVKVELDDNDYLIYTDGVVNDAGDLVCYASIYSFDGTHQVLSPVNDSSTLEFLDEILINLERKVSKESNE